MTSSDLLNARAADLAEFFRGRFGLRWSAEVVKRFGDVPQFRDVRRGEPGRTSWGLPKAFKAAEAWAAENGFHSLPVCHCGAFERTSVRQLGTVLETIRSSPIAPFLSDYWTLERVLKNLVQHKFKHIPAKNDVISPRFVELCPSEQRTLGPVPFDQACVNFTLARLLGHRPLQRPGPAISTGGRETHRVSLSDSRAELEIARADPQLELSLRPRLTPEDDLNTSYS